MSGTSEKPGYQPLAEWWRQTSEDQLKMLLPKAAQYGSNSLERVGFQLARVGNRVPTAAESQELGCYFYALGKMERWSDAVLRGEQCSDDTLLDLETYCRMVLRIRQAGEWPGKVEPHK